MRPAKLILRWFILFIFFSLVSVKLQPGQMARAFSDHTQATIDYFVYLPVVFTPGYIYLPIISSGPALPNWPGGKWMGPDGVSAVAVDDDPHNADIFYTATVGAGVFKSSDAGRTWSWSSEGLGNLTLDSLAIDPVNSSILYAGTHGDGVYRSNDAGRTWFPVNNGIQSGAVVYTLAVNPGNHNLLYAGTRDQGTFTGGVEHYQGKLYKSTDGGASWYNTLITNDDWAYSIAADANHPSTILAAIHATGPYISNDYGDTWQLANISGGEWNKGRAVAFDPRSSLQRAYYAGWHGDFYVSSNNGASWTESNTGLGFSHIFPNGIAIQPNNPDVIYLADFTEGPAGVMKSTNAGGSWSAAGLAAEEVYSVAASSNALLAGTYLDGIYRSIDGGASWSPTQAGILNAQVTGLAFPQLQVILAGTLGQGVRQSTDGGRTWFAFNNNLNSKDVNKLISDPARPNIIFALTNDQVLRRIDLSTGTTWQAASVISLAGTSQSKPSPYKRFEPLNDLLSLENYPAQPAIVPQPQLQNATSASQLLDMTFAPSNPAIAYLGTNGSGIYASADGGISWKQSGLMNDVVRSIAVDPQNPGHVLAIANDATQESVDGGQSWTTLPLVGIQVNGIAFPSDGANRVYAGTNQGLWVYQNKSWSFAGLASRDITTLAISPANPNWLLAGSTSGAFMVVTDAGEERAFVETSGIAVQSIAFDPKDPFQIYIGTVYRSTVHYTINH